MTLGKKILSCASAAIPCGGATTELPETNDVRMVASGAGEVLMANGNGEVLACTPSSCRTTLRTVARVPALDLDWTIGATNIAADGVAYYFVAKYGDTRTVMKVAK